MPELQLSSSGTHLGKLRNFMPIKKKAPKETITIYTDGSCARENHHGAYAAIIIYSNGHRVQLSGNFPFTNSCRMEMTAAVKALQHLHGEYDVKIYTDSMYLITQAETAKDPKKNADLIYELRFQMRRHNVQLIPVKSHSGNALNNEVHRLATKARKSTTG